MRAVLLVAAVWLAPLWSAQPLAATPSVAPVAKAASGAVVALEVQVKAAYLYKFAAYAEWPPGQFAGSDSPLIIGVLGADALASEIEAQTRDQSVHGRRFVVRRLELGDSLSGVHLLFVSGADPATLDAVFAAARRQPILTVTDSRAGQARGSIITFVVKGGRMRFEVALPPANASQIRLSALLLTAATRVVRDEK